MAKLPPVNLSTTLNVFRTRFNRLVDSVGDVSSLTTDTNTTVVQAINTIDSNLGTRTSLTTNDTTTFVASINELDSDIGDITTLTTSSTGDVVTAINSLFSDKLDSAHTQSMIDSNFTDSSRIATIPANVLTNNQLANNSVTVNGVEIALGASGSIDITDSGTSVALIKSTLSADSDTGIHYDSASATFSLGKIPNSSLGNVTFTINGVVGTIGGAITIEAIDSGATDGILDSAFADMTRDIVSRQPEFSITTNAGKMVFNTASEIVEFNEDTGTNTHISIGTPSGTGNSAAGRPTNSGVVEANKHLLMISDSATIRASDITLTADSNVLIDAEGAIILDAHYQEAKPYNTQGDIHFRRNGTNILTLEMNNASAMFSADNSRALVMSTNNNYFAVSSADEIRLDAGTGGPYVQFRRNTEDRLRFDYTKDGLLDSNSIISYQPLTITTSTSGDNIDFKSGSGQYNFYDSSSTDSASVLSVSTTEFKRTSAIGQDIVDSVGKDGLLHYRLDSAGARFNWNGSNSHLSIVPGGGQHPSWYAVDNDDWVIKTNSTPGAGAENSSLTIDASSIGLKMSTGASISLFDSDDWFGQFRKSAGDFEIRDKDGSLTLISESRDVVLDADEDIVVSPGSGAVYLNYGGALRGFMNLSVSQTMELYTYNTTSSSYVLNSTFTGEDLIVQGDITTLSDQRTKENVKTIEDGLEIVDTLRGVWYNKIGQEERKVGVIAQEVEKVLPEVVHTDNDGMKSVDYGKIVGVLIEAIKDLKIEIDDLKTKLGD